MAIRWARGFFRLWLVLALFWVGITAFLHRPDETVREFMVLRDRGQEIEANLERMSERLKDIESTEIEEMGEGEENPFAQFATDEQTDSTMSREITDAQTLALGRATERQISLTKAQLGAIELEQVLKVEDMQTAAAYTFGPPAGLFLIGALLAWALRGFWRSE